MFDPPETPQPKTRVREVSVSSRAGMPFRSEGPLPFLKDHEFDNLQERYEARVGIFRTWVPEELQNYQNVMNKIAEGHAQLSREETNWIDADKGWMLFVRWIEIHLQVPKKGSPL
mgnify:CR=1 FL=1